MVIATNQTIKAWHRQHLSYLSSLTPFPDTIPPFHHSRILKWVTPPRSRLRDIAVGIPFPFFLFLRLLVFFDYPSSLLDYF